MPTPDDFRALARSSPWRCTTAHFTHRSDSQGRVEAWLTRPDRVVYRIDGGPPVTRVEQLGESMTVVASFPEGEESAYQPPQARWGRDLEPVYRQDGLVAVRPDVMLLHWDDPFVGNYVWVAMLDPVELSAGVEVGDVAEVTHHGRRAWRARCVPVEGYSPRCGCCPLLWSWISDRDEASGGGPPPRSPGDYPDAYEVTLDHGTGFVVSLRPLGDTVRDDLGLDNEIHEAD